jgi:hypothetical protein
MIEDLRNQMEAFVLETKHAGSQSMHANLFGVTLSFVPLFFWSFFFSLSQLPLVPTHVFNSLSLFFKFPPECSCPSALDCVPFFFYFTFD